MGFWDELFGQGGSPPVIKEPPAGPTLYDEQIPDTFNLGWHYSEKKNQYQMAKITNDDRDSHFYVIGSTGTGKTKFLEYLIMQDILAGRGVGVIDPHGDLIEDIKGLLAVGLVDDGVEETLANSIILIDPTDPKYTVSFNPLERLPGISAAEQANELVSSFKKIWSDSWGVRMEDLMRNSLIALSEADLTLVELSAFLSNRRFREGVLQKVTNPVAVEYFQRFDSLTDRGQIGWIEPIMNKVNAIFADERIREIFSSTKSTFNLREAMDTGKTVLIKLDKGRLKDAANLLGALLVAKIQMAAFSRSDTDPEKRTPFYLYIDEFQNFASDSFAVILSEARKYGLYVTMAHQSLSQLSGELRNLILGSTGIQVYFRLSREDASMLAKEAFQYSGNWEEGISELQNLPPRISFVKSKIRGGIIHINTVPIEAPHDVLGIKEEEFRKYMKLLPFGEKYLVERQKLIALSNFRRASIRHQEERREEPKHRPVMETRALPKPMKETIPHHEEVEVIEPEVREKGTSRHQYLQSLIKKAAEENGYKAVIEQPTPDGLGRVDVSLERDGERIACEISVTTTSAHELENIEKCLKAGYSKVFMCSFDKRNLEKIKSLAADKLSDDEMKKVMFLEPEALLFHFENEAAREDKKEERIKGYRVKVKYQAVSKTDKEIKREAVAQVITGAFRRFRRKIE